jgi:ribosomal protein L37E
MALIHCPHCGAENFTMEGWEDLDHCSSCGKPLAEPIRDPRKLAGSAPRRGKGARTRHQGRKGQNAGEPRRA